MAEIKYVGVDALNQIVKEVPIIFAGDNITITPDADSPNKITISSALNFETANIDFDTEWDG